MKKGTYALFVLLFITVLIAISQTANAQTLVTGKRLAGDNRYETAVSISKSGWPGGAQNVVIATGEDFPDALCAAPLAKAMNAPILLTGKDILHPEAEKEIKRLNVKKAYIIGGNNVISKKVEDQIKGMDIECIRIEGPDRYGTSAAVAAEMKNAVKAVLVTGQDFPDALSIASWAAAKGMPILLTKRYEVPEDVDRYIHKNKINVEYVVGGSNAVDSQVVDKFTGAERIAGDDRYTTNISILNKFSNDFEYGSIYMATGSDFPDALAGSALAASSKSPLILVSLNSAPGAKALIDSKSGRLGSVFLLGGANVVDSYTISKILPQLIVGIDIEMPAASVGVDKQMKALMSAVTIEGNRVNENIAYSIKDPEIASINSEGMITGYKLGETSITASLGVITVNKAIAVRDSRLIVIDPGHGGWDGGASAIGIDGKSIYQSREAVLNMQVAQKLESKLEGLGYTVVMTRDGDNYVSLRERAKFSNSLNPDLFISVHHDSLNRLSTGTSSFYSDYKPGIDTEGLYVVAGNSGRVYDLNDNVIGNLSAGKSYPYVSESEKGIYIIFNGVQARVSIDDVMIYDNNPSMVSKESQKIAQSINKNISDLGIIPRGAKDRNLAVTRLTDGVSVLLEVGFISNPYEFIKISSGSFQDQVADGIARAIDDYFSSIN